MRLTEQSAVYRAYHEFALTRQEAMRALTRDGRITAVGAASILDHPLTPWECVAECRGLGGWIPVYAPTRQGEHGPRMGR